MSVALVLAGHGSHILPETAGVVWGYVEALRQLGVADEITAAFWKEQPGFNRVLDTLISDTVIVVPVFTASGFYTRSVIPAEMRLSGTVTQRSGRTIYLTPPLGEHPQIGEVVQLRVQDALQTDGLKPSEAAIAVIGHGTPRSKTTQITARTQADALRARYPEADVLEAFLDDEPDIPSLYQRTQKQHLIAVPFFLAPGSHVAIDVPEALGILYGEYPAQASGRTVYYTPPIGTEDVILRFILQLARDTGVQLAETLGQNPWTNFPQAGAEALIKAVQQADAMPFGDLLLQITSVTPLNSTLQHQFNTPAALRHHLREDPFRPLASSVDLPRDWIVALDDVASLPAVVETIYPGAIAEWAHPQNITPLPEVITRQQGSFRELANADPATIAKVVSSVCGRCCKHPQWHELAPGQALPCLSPCNVWLSTLSESVAP